MAATTITQASELEIKKIFEVISGKAVASINSLVKSTQPKLNKLIAETIDAFRDNPKQVDRQMNLLADRMKELGMSVDDLTQGMEEVPKEMQSLADALRTREDKLVTAERQVQQLREQGIVAVLDKTAEGGAKAVVLTQQEIREAKSVKLEDLKDPVIDDDRVKKDEWLVLVGICTHLGCVPLGQKITDMKGEYNGWYCPCHGSHYDSSGRIRKGPAPTNLAVPPYNFINDTTIKIG